MPACQAPAFQTLPETPRKPEHKLRPGVSCEAHRWVPTRIVKTPMVGSDLGDIFGPHVRGIYLQCPSLTFLLLPQAA